MLMTFDFRARNGSALTAIVNAFARFWMCSWQIAMAQVGGDRRGTRDEMRHGAKAMSFLLRESLQVQFVFRAFKGLEILENGTPSADFAVTLTY